MQIRWHGQSAFHLTGSSAVVLIDPFDVSAIAARLPFDFPPIEPAPADLLLITHEHGDHNWAPAATGDPAVIRSTAGTIASPVGDVVAIASEHDAAAGTVRGPNTIFVFSLDGIRICHMGDFGQPGLRPEQVEAIGRIDLLMAPVGGGPTIGAEHAARISQRLAPRWVVPMHYRTPQIGFLETADAFCAGQPRVRRLEAPTFDLDAAARPPEPQVLLLAPPPVSASGPGPEADTGTDS